MQSAERQVLVSFSQNSLSKTSAAGTEKNHKISSLESSSGSGLKKEKLLNAMPLDVLKAAKQSKFSFHKDNFGSTKNNREIPQNSTKNSKEIMAKRKAESELLKLGQAEWVFKKPKMTKPLLTAAIPPKLPLSTDKSESKTPTKVKSSQRKTLLNDRTFNSRSKS